MKKGVPTWAWIVMGILTISIIMLLIINYNSVSLGEYTQCVTDLGNSTMKYALLVGDYIELLNCYRNALPRCEALIQKGYNASVFTLGAGW